MTLDLEAIKARAEAATPGPWEAYNANEDTNYGANWCVANEAFHNPPADEDEEWLGLEVHVGDKPDSDFIAHAREDVPALIAEVERLRDIVADVIVARSNYPRIPECDRYTADDTISCGWKSAIESIDRTLDGTP